MNVIPAIDLIRSRAVRLFKGNFDEVRVYATPPVEIAAAYRAAGADWLHVVDLEGSRAAQPRHQELIARLAAMDGLSIQVGGGLRSADEVRAALDAGAARAVIGSLAVKEPDRFRALLAELGPERITLAADVRVGGDGVPRVASGAWLETGPMSVYEQLASFVPDGLRHVLCTDIGRDGTQTGCNVELYRRLTRKQPSLKVQASGGVGSLEDLRSLAPVAVAGVIVGKALLEKTFTLEEARAC